MLLTAILIDGAFCLKRLKACYPNENLNDAENVATLIHDMAWRHINNQNEKNKEHHYHLCRIFFYDCAPLSKGVHTPILKLSIDFSKTETSKFRKALHEALTKKRKIALRLGETASSSSWQLHETTLKALLKREKQWADLTDDDFRYDIKQKGVDMRIGLDISSMALKKQVHQMILISGDSDFVPAAKLSRREGVDFILDPMWTQNIPDKLSEHVDGIQSVCSKPIKKS
jgi:uncharacterized LabA/DUF88 family protein